MALSRAFADAEDNSGSGTTLTCAAFDSSAYDYIVVFGKHEQGSTTITFTDNKLTDFTPTSQVNHSNGDLNVAAAYGEIGTPGTSHTVTMTLGAARVWREMAVWLINSDTDTAIQLDVSALAQGTGSTPDAGTLSTTAATASLQYSGGYTTQTGSPGTGWTENHDLNNNYGQSRTDASGSLDPSHSFTGSADWATIALSFKEAGGGGPTASGRMALLGAGF